MKITHIMLATGFGGAERHFVDLALGLTTRGIAVQAICHPEFSERRLLEGQPQLSLTTVPVFGWWDRLAGWRIARALKGFAPDVVHVHLARASHIGGRAAHAAGIPVVVNTHNYIKFHYYRHVDHFVSPTVKQIDYLLNGGIEKAHTSLIPHFTTTRPAAIRGRTTAVRFAAIGRFVKKKGFDLLLLALQQVRARGIDASLSLAGDGPERGLLEQQVAALGLTAHVNMLGWVDGPEAVFNGADIFVLPSLDEPFGIVVLEAMASGIPLVTTRTDGPLEILDDASTYFAEIGSADSLAVAMAAAAMNADERARKCAAALMKFRAHYSDDAVVPQYCSLYATLAGAT